MRPWANRSSSGGGAGSGTGWVCRAAAGPRLVEQGNGRPAEDLGADGGQLQVRAPGCGSAEQRPFRISDLGFRITGNDSAALEAYLDEALPAEQMAWIERQLREHPELVGRLAAILARHDAGPIAWRDLAATPRELPFTTAVGQLPDGPVG